MGETRISPPTLVGVVVDSGGSGLGVGDSNGVHLFLEIGDANGANDNVEAGREKRSRKDGARAERPD